MDDENNYSKLRLLGVIATGLLGACFWMFPYFGALTEGYVTLNWLFGASLAGFVGLFITLKVASELPDDFGISLFIGTAISVVVWVGMIFGNTYANNHDMLVIESNGQIEIAQPTEERFYPFWNNDFIRVTNVAEARVSYEMDTPCEGANICTVEATVTYTITPNFVGIRAYGVTNYTDIMTNALTIAVVRDGANTIPEVEAALCANFKTHFNIAADAPCPLTTRVSVSVTQK